MSLRDDATAEAREAELRRTIRSLEKRLANREEREAELRLAVYQAARDAAVSHPPAVKVPGPPRDQRSKPSEAAIVHATDWQVGKRTQSYSSEVAERRIAAFGERCARIVELHRAARPVRHGVLLLGGDMVEGTTIFPGQAWEVDSGLFAQLFRTASMIEQLVRRLLAVFERLDVYEVAGNHGRIGRKGEMPGGDNIDRMAYAIARDRVEVEKRLTWHPAAGWHVIAAVGNYRALLAHGDQIKSFGGNTPAFGVLRKVTAWASGVTEPFSDAYLGHFHTPMTLTLPNGARIYMSGSPESDNQYAAEFVAAKGFPSQRLNFVDPARGRVTAEHHVWLDEGA